jgi:NAD(P)-dependent dehydrogenase (short-subunit alcohol dehydrogenase family)
MAPAPIAFVTGASRGIGKAGALALAEAGYDVVVTARTLQPGQKHDYAASSADAGTPMALPGSVEETAALVEERGQRALPLRLDLLDRESIDAAIERTFAEWDRIDVLFNNGIYQGAGVMDPFLELPEDKLRLVLEGNFFNQFYLTRKVLVRMLEQEGAGTIVNMTSNAGQYDPPNKVSEGGWGFAYGASKSAFHRMAGFLHVEFNDRGIRAYNIDPGYVPTEAQLAKLGKDDPIYQQYISQGAPVEVPAKALVWVCTHADAPARSGQTIHAPRFVKDHGLLPGWPPPRSERAAVATGEKR